MRILIVSDTHGKHENLEIVLQKNEPFDLMIHLGDAEVDQEELAELVKCPVEIIAGNMDRDPSLEYEKLIQVEDYKILLCHGHRLGVNSGLLRLEYHARELEADIAMYGHTHVPYVDQTEDLTIVNPGSLSYPRPWGAQPSYAVMEIDAFGGYEIQHFAL